MIKQLNRLALKPFGIPSETSKRNESFNKYSDLNRDRVQEKDKTLVDKGLFFMLSVSTIWFFTFLYFILYVFT